MVIFQNERMEIDEEIIMFDNAMSITKIGITAGTFLLIVLASFYLLSAPVNSILGAFNDADFNDAEDEMNEYYPIFTNVLTLFWAIFLALPLTWIVIKVMAGRETAFDLSRYKR